MYEFEVHSCGVRACISKQLSTVVHKAGLENMLCIAGNKDVLLKRAFSGHKGILVCKF